MKINFDFVTAFYSFSAAFAQDTFAEKATLDTTDSVIVHKDPRSGSAGKKNKLRSMKKPAVMHEEMQKDFACMIISTNNRDEAIAAKTKVYTYFPELKAYLWYQSPYFKLKVGNFKERKDAESYQKRLECLFSQRCFYMNDVMK